MFILYAIFLFFIYLKIRMEMNYEKIIKIGLVFLLLIIFIILVVFGIMILIIFVI